MERKDFQKAKRWYITHAPASYKKTAEKFGLSQHSLREVSCREKWYDQRKEYRLKSDKKALEKTIEKEAEAEANNLTEFLDTSAEALKKIRESLAETERSDREGLRKIVASLKDLKSCLILDKEEEGPSNVRIELSHEWEQILDG